MDSKDMRIRDLQERIFQKEQENTQLKQLCEEKDNKLRAFFEGLEMTNIEALMNESADDLKRVGEIMASNIKSKIDSNGLKAEKFLEGKG